VPDRIIYAGQRKDGTEELRVTAGEFNGRPTHQIRVWFKGSDGEFRPTKAGVSIRGSEMSDVIKALTKLESELR
jgi:hypothetical protein